MKVAILGVGLIGGSIGLAARARADAHVCGYDPNDGVCASALALGAIDAQASDIATAVANADIVFAAAPIGALSHIVTLALQHAPANCVVSDVGSTKRFLAHAAADERFIGGHPLAGAETAGVEHAREDLFDGATWYLTPAQRSTAGVLYERLHRLLSRIGARPVAIDADSHDRIMACVSHLPHVLANLLVAQATSLPAANDRHDPQQPPQLPAVGPSFRDATRVAGANSAIWTDIYIANRDAIIAGIDELAARLADVRAALNTRDAPAIAAWNERARTQHEALLGAGLAGAAGGQTVGELRVSVPNQPGVIADIALALGGSGVNILDMVLSPSHDNRQGIVALWIAGEVQLERAKQRIARLGFPVVQA